MISTDLFGNGFGKVSHSLINDWTWEKINKMIKTNTDINPKYLRQFKNNGFTLGGMEHDPYIKSILDFMHPLKPNYYARAGLYAGLKYNSETFDIHSDPGQHLWVWQIIGNTQWQVEDEYLILNTNDVLYISPGLKHKAIPDSPRASISLSLEEFN